MTDTAIAIVAMTAFVLFASYKEIIRRIKFNRKIKLMRKMEKELNQSRMNFKR
jgi:hypothetical protein